jgi:hypothetical protein
MNPGGGVASLFGFRLPLYTQDLDMYGTDGTELGTVSTSMNTLDILGIDATPFTVTGSEYADGEFADGEFADGVTAGLPAEGTVYSVTDLFGLTNIYQAIAGRRRRCGDHLRCVGDPGRQHGPELDVQRL